MIEFSITPCPLGYLLMAATERGICDVTLSEPAPEISPLQLEAALRQQFPNADLRRNDVSLKPWMEVLLQHLEGRRPELDIPLDVQGTPFQLHVWQALRAIPYGETRTYKQVALAIGQPDAVRAVGGACGANTVALIIPCHRVVRTGGVSGGFRWGSEKKRLLLQREAECSGRALNLTLSW